jgi:RNA polymerase sigma factor (sigma-70 family)
MTDDLSLLRAYGEQGSDDAFRTLLDRHLPLVHSSALRQVHDPQLAEEVTQAVFIILARKAHSLHAQVVLAGWLFRTTRYVAARAIRDEQRRQRRAQEVAHMEMLQSTPAIESSWNDVEPNLDEALANLGETDRHAILLRFFEKKELKEVGKVLGSTEDAAQKRVSRALDKLRGFLGRRGIALSTVTLAGALAQNAVQAAPLGLSTTTFTVVASKAGTVSCLALVKGALQSMFYAKLKMAGLIAGGFLAVVGAGISTISLLNPPPLAQFVPLSLAQADGTPLTNFTTGRLWGVLPKGRHNYDGVPFEMDRRVQLHGNVDARESRRHPASVIGIPVHQSLSKLHLVQGANISEREGTPIAALRLNYKNGASHLLFVRYGVHTREWWDYPNEVVSAVTDPNTSVVWTGRSEDGDSKGATHRIFRTTFDLPASDETVETIDCLSLFSRSSLIILGMTGETGHGSIQRVTASPDISRFREKLDLTVLDQAGLAVPGARVLGTARIVDGSELVLGKLDDTFTSPGVVPVDCPANTREVRLRISAPGFAPAGITLTSGPGALIRPRALVRLRALGSDPPPGPVETAEEAVAAAASVQGASELKRGGQYREAIAAFNASIKLHPHHSDSYHGRAQALRETGDFVDALVNHDRAVELDPQRYDLYWERGVTCLRIRAFDDAIADFEQCLARNRAFTDAQRGLECAQRSRTDFTTELPNLDFARAFKPKTE